MSDFVSLVKVTPAPASVIRAAARIDSIEITLSVILDQVRVVDIPHDDAAAVVEGIQFLKVRAEELAYRQGFDNQPLIMQAMDRLLDTWCGIVAELS